MSSMQFQADVARTIAPITDATYERIIPLDVSITLRHLLDLMRDADLQKRRVFYGQDIRTEDCAEWEALSQVANRLSAIPDTTASSGKGIFAKPIPSIALNPQSGMGTETRSRLDNLLNRYHSVLGMLSEIAELAIIDTMILQELLTQLYADPTLNDFDDIIEDVKYSVQATLNSANAGVEIKDDNARQFEELSDALFYIAHHLLTNQSTNCVTIHALCSAVSAKLGVRYPYSFDTSLSYNTKRDREAEMRAFYTVLDTEMTRNSLYLKNEQAWKGLEHRLEETKGDTKEPDNQGPITQGSVPIQPTPSPSAPVSIEDAEGRNIDDVLSLPRPAVDPTL